MSAIVVECEYILPTSSTTLWGYPSYSIIVSNLAWSIEPKAFIYGMYMSSLENLMSSSDDIKVCKCLHVHFSTLIHAWLSISI